MVSLTEADRFAGKMMLQLECCKKWSGRILSDSCPYTFVSLLTRNRFIQDGHIRDENLKKRRNTMF